MSMLPKDQIDSVLRKTYGGDKAAFLRDIEVYLQSLPGTSPNTTQRPKRSFADAPAMIEAFDVTRSYKVGRKNIVPAVQGINLTIHEGEIVALTGPSGSGKSTLMHLIGGLDKPTSGDIIVA